MPCCCCSPNYTLSKWGLLQQCQVCHASSTNRRAHSARCACICVCAGTRAALPEPKKKKSSQQHHPCSNAPAQAHSRNAQTQPETSHRVYIFPLLPPHRRTKKQSHLPRAKHCARSDAMPSSGRRTINTMRAHTSPHGSRPEAQYTAASDNNLLGPIVRNKRYCSAASHGQQQRLTIHRTTRSFSRPRVVDPTCGGVLSPGPTHVPHAPEYSAFHGGRRLAAQYRQTERQLANRAKVPRVCRRAPDTTLGGVCCGCVCGEQLRATQSNAQQGTAARFSRGRWGRRGNVARRICAVLHRQSRSAWGPRKCGGEGGGRWELSPGPAAMQWAAGIRVAASMGPRPVCVLSSLFPQTDAQGLP